MDSQLDRVCRAYDLTVEQHRKGVNPLDDIPQDIRDSPFYQSLTGDSGSPGSGAPDVREYLAPAPGMRFLDAGCSANLVNYRLDRWPSTYYGIDISPRLIEAMQRFADRERISTRGLHVAEVARMPFADGFFDIGAAIGVLEYCTLEYVGEALSELHRVLKADARLVLDIPNRDHPHAGYMARLEAHQDRPIFLHARLDFERLLKPLFSQDRVDDSRVMVKYFVRRRK